MEQLKNVMLADLQVVVIGGSHRYYSSDDLATFFSPSNGDAYNKHIDVGHIADLFMGGSQGGAVVLHFPAIDSQEMTKEAKDLANRTGDFIDMSEAELERRVSTLFRDETVKVADAIGSFPLSFRDLHDEDPASKWSHDLIVDGPPYLLVINQDVGIPIPDDGSFENYIRYLGNINQRANRVMRSICYAWKRTSQANPRPRRIIVLRNSLFWLSIMHLEASIESLENPSRQMQPWEPTEELQSEVRFTSRASSSALPGMLISDLH